LVHIVLLLLLAVPVTEFDLLAFRAEPAEVIPTVGEGRHPTDLHLHGHVAVAEGRQLVTRGRVVDTSVDEETDLRAVEHQVDWIPGHIHSVVALEGKAVVVCIARDAARVGKVRLRVVGGWILLGQEHRQELRWERDGVIGRRQLAGLGDLRDGGGAEGGGDADEGEGAEARGGFLHHRFSAEVLRFVVHRWSALG